MSYNPFDRAEVEAAVRAFTNANNMEDLIRAVTKHPVMLTEPFFRAIEMSMQEHPEARVGLAQRLITLKALKMKIQQEMAKEKGGGSSDLKSGGGFGGSSSLKSSGGFGSSSSSSYSSKSSSGDNNSQALLGIGVVIAIIVILVLVL
jgi:hypothetical protein